MTLMPTLARPAASPAVNQGETELAVIVVPLGFQAVLDETAEQNGLRLVMSSGGLTDGAV